jgi:sporulation protein YlmC with PRC-barrel domain
MRARSLPIVLAALGLAGGLALAPDAAQAQDPAMGQAMGQDAGESIVDGEPVETLGNRLLPAPGDEEREFRVGELEGAPVALGDENRVGTVRDVVVGLEEQRSFVVEYNDRLGGRTVLIPIGETVIRDGRIIAAYTLNQLRALPTLNEYEAANLSPIAQDVAIRLRRSELDLSDVETTGQIYDPTDDDAAR